MERDTRDGILSVEILSSPKTSTFEEAWYELALESHFWFQWRWLAFSRQMWDLKVPLNKELKALEVGCGRGILSGQVEASTRWNVDGADLSLSALSTGKRGRGRRLLYDVREEKKEFLEAYDVLIVFDVLEHMRNTRGFLSSALRHLKGGGFFFIDVPAFQVFHSPYDVVMGHLRRYSKKTLVKEFGGFSLKIVDLRYWGFSMVPLLAMRKILLAGIQGRNQIVKSGFRPPQGLGHTLLRAMMRVETALFSSPPAGTSLLMVGIKC